MTDDGYNASFCCGNRQASVSDIRDELGKALSKAVQACQAR